MYNRKKFVWISRNDYLIRKSELIVMFVSVLRMRRFGMKALPLIRLSSDIFMALIGRQRTSYSRNRRMEEMRGFCRCSTAAAAAAALWIWHYAPFSESTHHHRCR